MSTKRGGPCALCQASVIFPHDCVRLPACGHCVCPPCAGVFTGVGRATGRFSRCPACGLAWCGVCARACDASALVRPFGCGHQWTCAACAPTRPPGDFCEDCLREDQRSAFAQPLAIKMTCRRHCKDLTLVPSYRFAEAHRTCEPEFYCRIDECHKCTRSADALLAHLRAAHMVDADADGAFFQSTPEALWPKRTDTKKALAEHARLRRLTGRS